MKRAAALWVLAVAMTSIQHAAGQACPPLPGYAVAADVDHSGDDIRCEQNPNGTSSAASAAQACNRDSDCLAIVTYAFFGVGDPLTVCTKRSTTITALKPSFQRYCFYSKVVPEPPPPQLPPPPPFACAPVPGYTAYMNVDNNKGADNLICQRDPTWASNASAVAAFCNIYPGCLAFNIFGGIGDPPSACLKRTRNITDPTPMSTRLCFYIRGSAPPDLKLHFPPVPPPPPPYACPQVRGFAVTPDVSNSRVADRVFNRCQAQPAWARTPGEAASVCAADRSCAAFSFWGMPWDTSYGWNACLHVTDTITDSMPAANRYCFYVKLVPSPPLAPPAPPPGPSPIVPLSCPSLSGFTVERGINRLGTEFGCLAGVNVSRAQSGCSASLNCVAFTTIDWSTFCFKSVMFDQAVPSAGMCLYTKVNLPPLPPPAPPALPLSPSPPLLPPAPPLPPPPYPPPPPNPAPPPVPPGPPSPPVNPYFNTCDPGNRFGTQAFAWVASATYSAFPASSVTWHLSRNPSCNPTLPGACCASNVEDIQLPLQSPCVVTIASTDLPPGSVSISYSTRADILVLSVQVSGALTSQPNRSMLTFTLSLGSSSGCASIDAFLRLPGRVPGQYQFAAYGSDGTCCGTDWVTARVVPSPPSVISSEGTSPTQTSGSWAGLVGGLVGGVALLFGCALLLSPLRRRLPCFAAAMAAARGPAKPPPGQSPALDTLDKEAGNPLFDGAMHGALLQTSDASFSATPSDTALVVYDCARGCDSVVKLSKLAMVKKVQCQQLAETALAFMPRITELQLQLRRLERSPAMVEALIRLQGTLNRCLSWMRKCAHHRHLASLQDIVGMLSGSDHEEAFKQLEQELRQAASDLGVPCNGTANGKLLEAVGSIGASSLLRSNPSYLSPEPSTDMHTLTKAHAHGSLLSPMGSVKAHGAYGTSGVHAVGSGPQGAMLGVRPGDQLSPAGSMRPGDGLTPAGSVMPGDGGGLIPAGSYRAGQGLTPAGSYRAGEGLTPAGSYRAGEGLTPAGSLRHRPGAMPSPLGSMRLGEALLPASSLRQEDASTSGTGPATEGPARADGTSSASACEDVVTLLRCLARQGDFKEWDSDTVAQLRCLCSAHAVDLDRVLEEEGQHLKLEAATNSRAAAIMHRVEALEYIALADIHGPAGQGSTLQFLSQGGHASVYRGVWQGEPVAVKRFDSVLSARVQEEMAREAYIMSSCRHPNIAEIYGLAREAETGIVCVVMRYYHNGSLSDLVKREDGGGLTLAAKLQVAMDIARGMAYLHARPNEMIVHGDLKPGNVLLDEDMRCHISDFGMSSMTTDTRTLAPTSKAQSTPYTAPELLEALTYTGPPGPAAPSSKRTTDSDVFSYGATLLELFTGHPPFHGVDAYHTMLMIVNGKRPHIPPCKRGLDANPAHELHTPGSGVPRSIAQLIESCWSQEPFMRPSFSQITLMLETAAVALHIQLQ